MCFSCSWMQRIGASWSAGWSLYTNTWVCPLSAAAWQWTSWTGFWHPLQLLLTAFSYWESLHFSLLVNRCVFKSGDDWSSVHVYRWAIIAYYNITFSLSILQVEVCSPRISHLLSLCCDAFNKEQLCNLECLILVRLDFRLAAPTLAFFLDCYTNFKTAPLISGNNVDSLNKDSLKISSRHCRKLAQKLCELSLADYAFNKYPPSLTASCALNLSIEIQQQGPMLSQEDHWDSFMEESNDAHNLIDGVIISSKSCQASTSHMESTDYSLIQECRNNLRLLVSLNQEALKIWWPCPTF